MTPQQGKKLLGLAIGFWLLVVLYIAHPALGVVVASALAYRHHRRKVVLNRYRIHQR